MFKHFDQNIDYNAMFSLTMCRLSFSCEYIL